MDSKTVLLNFPWPPSVNTYWRTLPAGRVILSAKGRDYRNEVCEYVIAEGVRHHTERLKVEIYAFVPDRRRRDLDNILKALFDALEHAGVYEDDEQIDDLRIVRRPRMKPGCLAIVITELESGWDDELGDSP
jgi:crossover junction endodeoxyribonuclease RusA